MDEIERKKERRKQKHLFKDWHKMKEAFTQQWDKFMGWTDRQTDIDTRTIRVHCRYPIQH